MKLKEKPSLKQSEALTRILKISFSETLKYSRDEAHKIISKWHEKWDNDNWEKQ